MRIRLNDDRILVVNKEFLDVFTEEYTILEPDEVNVVYQSCTPAQGLAAMYLVKGITEEDILTALNTITDANEKYLAKLAYSKTTEWRIDSPAMGTVSDLLSLTREDLEHLFSFAKTIEV